MVRNSVADVFGRDKFSIPQYQRDYAWKRQNFVDLWEDLEEAIESKDSQGHFLGTIVVAPNKENSQIMPQKWEENWTEIGKDKETAETLIYQIGNMTLLNGSLNASISNAKWIEKLGNEKSKKNCIKKCADLLVTREILDKKESVCSIKFYINELHGN